MVVRSGEVTVVVIDVDDVAHVWVVVKVRARTRSHNSRKGKGYLIPFLSTQFNHEL